MPAGCIDCRRTNNTYQDEDVHLFNGDYLCGYHLSLRKQTQENLEAPAETEPEE